jgi:hypothetical protein
MKVGLLRRHRALALLLLSTAVTGLAGAAVDNTAIATDSHPGASKPRSKAKAAKSLIVKETAQLHQIWRHGTQHQEEGKGVGTFPYLLSVNFSAGFTQAKVVFAIHGKGGTIYGHGTPSYHVEGSTAYFKGSLSITQGTGTYAHASGTGLQLQGTLNRHNYTLSIAVYGKMSV